MNGGSIVAITQLDTLAKPLFMAAGAWFVAGIGFTFVAGAATWFNWSFATEVYDNWADPRMIETSEAWPKDDDDLGAKVTASRWMAISMATIALYCLIGGVAEILNFLRLGI
ncbi:MULTISPECIES: hypothetical protein [unclassified Aureimonas]|uniref:hypothetical protein n=1 Tax=unclassified Aureimonas TaxID=2615206 RepID=UPI0006FCFD74|nr:MULTISPECIES: hypothetical protein [unclassified Aureimonas]KQT61254.1 hypothetical protein ASG54_24255 [Aureimonas sp. Leaf460]KQT68703.1 hypothetical protein ASG62_19015 [Aureimonas sp. Leaf427]